ncbi:MAG: pentapeptide repeat-containing protein [Firmicutes bacterium]|nr:pentapeptide repeat-containing protein [Bacillota bacterium]
MLNAMVLGERIAIARKGANLSQTELAASLSVSPQAVSKWERGESLPDVITLSKIAQVLHVKVNIFIDELPEGRGQESEELGIRSEEWRMGSQRSNPSGAPHKPRLTFNSVFRQPADESDGGEGEQAQEPPLTGAQARKADSRRSLFRYGNWGEADFRGVTLPGEKFDFGNLKRVDFTGADLAGSSFKCANLYECTLDEANLTDCSFDMSNLRHASLRNAKLAGAKMFRSDMTDCDFSDASLLRADIKAADMKRCGLFGANLSGAYIRVSNFSKCGVENIVLDDVIFERSVFADITFSGITFKNTVFRMCNLKRVTFENCVMDKITYNFLKACKADLEDVKISEN